jgi:hypothetical protein
MLAPDGRLFWGGHMLSSCQCAVSCTPCLAAAQPTAARHLDNLMLAPIGRLFWGCCIFTCCQCAMPYTV